jgi:serine phosphatase RsbU (regulator of sigma subunit)
MVLEVAEASLYRERMTRIFLFCILTLLVLIALFIANRLRHTRRQKQAIEDQKLIVEQKNEEILDSINYAKRLQEAILPQLPNIKNHLPLDILYLPKDIIGGDFYFFENYSGKIFIGICDCTGHGIPGAIMSVVCHHALEKSIREFNLTDPALILKRARQIIIESLNAAEQNIRDGMDCSLLVIDSNTRQAAWAGAYNPLWILQDKKFVEIKADKQSVSYYEHLKDFHTHQLALETGNLIYLFTDGYADQFGGANAKKYKYKTLKEFLISISDHSPSEQVRLLKENFYAWKGTLDQVDDVAIAVIRIA